MTTSHAPRGSGHEPRLRPSDERALLAQANRTTRRVAVLALVLGLAAVGFAAWRFAAGSDAGCQSTAWSTTPAVDSLPYGWTISSSQYDVNRKTMTLVGPAPTDGTSSQAVLYATITCFPQGAAESVSRSQDAAAAAGETVTARSDLGDQGFVADDSSGAVFLQFRHDNVVVYLAASGDATSDEVDTVASAFDLAMGGDGGEAPVGTPDVGSSTPSAEASAAPASEEPLPTDSPAAPELESALPTSVAGVDLTVESAIGSSILGSDQGSRAILAALRADGLSADDLHLAQAYDPTGQSDLSFLAVGVAGMQLDALRNLVMTSWLAASGAGVTTQGVTMGGHDFTRVDYGDGGAMDYVLAEKDFVLIIETADAELAAQAAAALP